MSLRCWLGHHATPVRDRAQDGTKVWRCPRCLRVRPREVRDVLAAVPRNTDPRWRMPARDQHEARSSAIRALRGVEQRRLGAAVMPFRRRA